MMENKYIRADLFMNKIAESAFFSAVEKAKIRVAIEEEPGENINPVVHAHWIERRAENGNMHYICSHCGKEVSYPYAKKRWKSCIECGAKMDAMTTETREDVEPYGISSNSNSKLN